MPTHIKGLVPNLSKQAEALLPTQFGVFRIIVFLNSKDKKEHIALIKGNVRKKKSVLTRIHSECLTGEVFHSKRCDCGPQFDKALKIIAQEGLGVMIYLRQEGRGIGLINKIRAYNLQEKGLDTFEANKKLGFQADERRYDIASEILKFLGVSSIRLITNNPHKIAELEKNGIIINERIADEIKPNDDNLLYLTAKKRSGHLLKKV